MDQIRLVARVEGFLTSIHFKDGDYVNKGDLLFLIEQDVYRSRVQQAEGQLAGLQAHLLRAGQEYERQSTLYRQSAAAKADVEKWKAERDAEQAKLVQAKANLELARINLGYTRVTAPFDGRMDRHLVTPGNLVGTAGATALADITRMDPIYAYFTLNERDLIRFMEKTPEEAAYREKTVAVFAGIQGQEGYPMEGRLDFVSTSLDPNTKEGPGTFCSISSCYLNIKHDLQLLPEPDPRGSLRQVSYLISQDPTTQYKRGIR